jgi:ferredoxin--NADP+ reductase
MNSPDILKSLKSAVISRNERIAENVYLLSFRREFDFLPGQVVGINTDNTLPARLYSIASGNRDTDISILFDIKDEGYLTPLLSRRKPGDTILVSEPFGSFICSEETAFWIAAGTGIAPFASMIFSGMSKGKTLIHGSRFTSHFYFQDMFSTVKDLTYIRCCSGEQKPGIFNGRITDYLDKQQDMNKSLTYYLCGSAEMVVDTRDVLIRKGIPYENIRAEIYF